ncbi:MAG TPA: hypothetical protein VK611_12405 [Acidimicrobiales bacterium]|nr:hypothetical protein [Acidimicrobiales bacterium]
MRYLLTGCAVVAALATLAACGADDRDMQRPSPDQTTTSLVRGTSTTVATVPPAPPSS